MGFHRKAISLFKQETENYGLCHASIVSRVSHTSKQTRGSRGNSKKKKKKNHTHEGGKPGNKAKLLQEEKQTIHLYSAMCSESKRATCAKARGLSKPAAVNSFSAAGICSPREVIRARTINLT